MNGKLLHFGLAILLLAGCADYQLVSYDKDQNYLTFSHTYTEKAVADAFADARKLCLKRKQAAIKTSSACSLEKCITNFQCVDSAEIIKDAL